ncbi:MAG: AAA family ATPase [Chloroflexota bacterium]
MRLKNFRSIADCDVELGPLTLLVGPNGSGKSNLLKALDLIRDALENGLEIAIKRQGGMDSLLSRWAFRDPCARLSIHIDLDLSDGRSGSFGLVLKRTRPGGYTIVKESFRVMMAPPSTSFEELSVSETERTWTNTRSITSSETLASPPTVLTLPRYADHVHFGPVYRALLGVSFYSLQESSMRQPQSPDSGERLLGNGSNVVSVFERLLDVNEDGWMPAERIVDWLGAITPGIVGIAAPVLDGYQVLRFEQLLEDGARPFTFSANEMSFGTIRALGVLVALYQGCMKGGSPVTLVAIEEPESAVHPGAATALVEAMDEASLTTQILATTHSASMLDHEDFDVNILRAVVRKNGRTVIGPIDASSRQVLDEALYSAGELLDMGHLKPLEATGDATQAEATMPA